MKTCTKCGETKPLGDFHKKGEGRIGSRCNTCSASEHKAWREANREAISARRKAYREANREAISARKKAYYEANRDAVVASTKAYRTANKERVTELSRKRNKAYGKVHKEKIAEKGREYRTKNRERLAATHRVGQRKRKSGFYPVHAEAAMQLQRGCCAVCGRDLTVLPTRQVHADHCHITYAPRGLLCHHCNCGLGHFKDDPNRLLAAIKYLLHPPLAGAQLA